MGIFGDIFKASDWSYNELKAINKSLMLMGAIDGEIDKIEMEATGAVITSLPGAEHVSDWGEFIKESAKMEPDEIYDTLAKMSLKKREVVVGGLGLVALADGVVDENENKFFIVMSHRLNVKVPS